MDKIGPHIARMITPDPTTNAFAPVSAATGADWSLTKMLPTRGNRIQSGFYQWFGTSSYEPIADSSNPFEAMIRWKPSIATVINYVVVDTPATVSPAVLSSILMLPRTTPPNAISPPLRRGVTYTPGFKPTSACPAQNSQVRESFTPECDPFGPNAYKDTSDEKSKLLMKIFGGSLITIAIIVAVFLALTLAGSNASIYIKEFGETAGAWIYKQIQSAKGGIGDLKGNILETIAAKALKV